MWSILIACPDWTSKGVSVLPAAIELFGLGFERVANELVNSFLSPSDCLRRWYGTCALCAHRRTSARQSFLSFPPRPAQANSLRTCHAAGLFRVPERNSCPNDFTEAGQPASLAVVSQQFVRRPAIWSHMELAVEPTTVSHHPADQQVIRIQSVSRPRLGGMLRCTQQFSQGTVCGPSTTVIRVFAARRLPPVGWLCRRPRS